jgi:hypothetical protein
LHNVLQVPFCAKTWLHNFPIISSTINS